MLLGKEVRATFVGLLLVLTIGPADAAFAAGPALGVDSGALQVRVEQDPFAIEFIDRRSGRVLRTLGGASAGRYGAPGYSFDLRIPVVNNAYLGYYFAAELETVWFHADRVISAERGRDGSLRLELAMNDPLGHRLAMRIKPRADGVASVKQRMVAGSGPLAGRASVSGMAFGRAGDTRFLGLGERSNAVDQTGNQVFNWAEEGPFSSGRGEPLLRPLIPDFTFPTGPSATNFPIPWTITSDGFGLLIDQPERSTFRFATDRSNAWHAEAESARFAATVFAGPTPERVLRRYSAFAGRQPEPATWFFGPWFQPTLEAREHELADRFRAEDVPVTVAQTYTHYLPCGVHRGKQRAERDRIRGYHRRGFRITTYFNPHICTTYQPVYDEAAAEGLLVENAAGEPYVLSNPFTADEMVSEIDFTRPGGVRLFQGLLDDAIDAGYDGWMEDFGEYTPTDSVFGNGRRGTEMHNRYPVLYHRASTEHTRRRMGRDAAVFVRSGYHGSQPYSRIVWGGDPTEDWSCSDGLCAAVHQALSIGLSGIAYWGSDIGGFHALVNSRTDDELTARWLQFGAVSGIMRTQANGLSFLGSRASRSQVWHEDVQPIWRRYSKLRTQLAPYIEAASDAYQRGGLPITRALALTYPDDARAVRSETEFLFGPDLLAAPVIEPLARARSLHLPAGRWIDLWRSVDWRERAGTISLGRARVLRGRREVSVPAPLEELPLFVRAGAVIPLAAPDVDTLSAIGDRARGVVSARERRDRMRLLAFPAGRSSARLPDGERLLSRAGRRTWRLKLDVDRKRRWTVEASLNGVEGINRVCAVELDGRPLALAAWDHRPATGVLTGRFESAAGTLAVHGCTK